MQPLHVRSPLFSRLIPIAFAAVLPSMALAIPIGSYTFKVKDDGAAPEGAKVLITAGAKRKDLVFDDPPFTVSGQDANQIRNTVRDSLAGDGWTVTDNGTNGINITKVGIPPTFTFASPIKKVNGGSSHKDVTVSLNGNVEIEKISPEDKRWKVGFAPGLGSSDEALALTLDLGPLGVFNTLVNNAPEQATLDLYDFLLAQAFPDVELLAATNEVAFFLAPSLEPIGQINELFVSGPDLHLSLTLPSEVP